MRGPISSNMIAKDLFTHLTSLALWSHFEVIWTSRIHEFEELQSWPVFPRFILTIFPLVFGLLIGMVVFYSSRASNPYKICEFWYLKMSEILKFENFPISGVTNGGSSGEATREGREYSVKVDGIYSQLQVTPLVVSAPARGQGIVIHVMFTSRTARSPWIQVWCTALSYRPQ